MRKKDLFLMRSLYVNGTKIKIISAQNTTLPSGSIGIIDFVDKDGRLHILTDFGSFVLSGSDLFLICEE